MRYLAALGVALLGAIAVIHYWPAQPAALPVETPLRLPARLTLIQRHDAAVPGSAGRLRVHIGDITRGQVDLTLTHRDGRVLISRTSVRQGDRRGFSLGGRRYKLALVTLRNNLVGDDWAVIEFYEGRAERERIKRLLDAVQHSSAVFLRNGQEYEGVDAAAHWRRKWNSVGDRIQTAEQFIEHIATRSSMSGRAYRMRLADGRIIDTSAWLAALLEDS